MRQLTCAYFASTIFFSSTVTPQRLHEGVRVRGPQSADRVVPAACPSILKRVYILTEKPHDKMAKSVISIKSHIAVQSTDYECSFGPRSSLESSAGPVFLPTFPSI